MSHSPSQRAAVREILTDVLSQVRPQEVFLVPTVYDKEVSVEGRTDALGFGIHHDVVIWMYPLFSVLKELAASASGGVAKKWGEHIAELFWSTKRNTVVDLGELSSFRTQVLERLTGEGVSVSDAQRTADTFISVLLVKPELVNQILGEKRNDR